MAEQEFSDVFVELRPNVWAIDDLWTGEVDARTADLGAATVTRERLGGGGETLGVAILDGGIVFHSREGVVSEDDDAHAFSDWVTKCEAAGQEWDEDDFEFVHDLDPDRDQLASGVYVIGRHGLRLVCDALAVAPPSGPDQAEPDIETLRQNASDHVVVMGDPDTQAAALADRTVQNDWDELMRDLADDGPGL